MYANVTATQSELVTVPYAQSPVAVNHARNLREINLSVYLSANALIAVTINPPICLRAHSRFFSRYLSAYLHSPLNYLSAR